MRFTATGKLKNFPPSFPSQSVTWEDGTFTGDEYAVDAVLFEARLRRRQVFGPRTGPFTNNLDEHLASPTSAMELIARCFELGFTATGDIPADKSNPNLLY